jgi:hypothetical protein
MPHYEQPAVDVQFNRHLRLSLNDKFRTEGAKSALAFAELYLNGMVTQWNRLAQGTNELNRLMWDLSRRTDPELARARTRVSTQIQVDVHLYVICWDKVANFLQLFNRRQRDSAISEIYSGVKGTLGRAIEARHFFEHYDEKLKVDKPPPFSFGGMGGDGNGALNLYSLSEEGEWMVKPVFIGRSEIERVARAYNGILSILTNRPSTNSTTAASRPPDLGLPRTEKP